MDVRLLDTNIVSYVMKDHPLAQLYGPHLGGYHHAISFQTVAELIEGATLAGWSRSKRKRLDLTLNGFLILESDHSVCENWAFVRSQRRLRPIGVADAWIAATALSYGLELVTHNPNDFENIPGLPVITEQP